MSAPFDPSQFRASRPSSELKNRRPVSLRGFILLEDGAAGDIVSVTDISYGGCSIDVPVELEPGQPIKLSVFRRGIIDAEVRWCSSGKAGLAFVHEDSAPAEQR